ncbi:MAG: YraN family protein [Zetaproteobacteria bacterium CG_4_9_14_3_um_filter_53_7]|nr:MAG: YraN family protein [Zetaproteobacteria bacterium CG_4_9_14_3_um_filter_53_7]
MSTATGQAGEERAARYLKHKGYTILGRNIRLGRGELDIVACSDELLLFVEVKTHKNRESGLLAMHEDKCARLLSAAESWLAGHTQYAHLQCRFDLIIVTPRLGLPGWLPPRIEHMRNIIN